MPDQTQIPVSKAIVTAKKECPLCNSKSRPYIDTVIMELRDSMPQPTNGHGNHHDSASFETEVVDAETVKESDALDAIGQEYDVDSDGGKNKETMTYLRIENSVRELLTKLNDSIEFTYADLLVHAGEHTLVTHVSGARVRTEGNYLIVGEEVYQRVDPKDALAVGISIGLQQILTGQLKLSASAWVNMQALLWRMQGNVGTDDFVSAMIEKTQSGKLNVDSPLGSAFFERQERLGKNKMPKVELTNDEADAPSSD